MITENVTVYTRSEDGQDEFGEPVYQFVEHEVSGVLVRQLDGERLDGEEDNLRPYGVNVEYVLAFPAAFDVSLLEGAQVVLSSRSSGRMDVKKVVIVPQSPLPWSSRVFVGRTDG